MRLVVATLVLVTGLAGCGRVRPTGRAAEAQPVTTAAVADAPTEDAPEGATPHGSRKQLQLDAPVFVDGAQIAVLRYGDLPPIAHTELAGGTPSFRLADWLEAIGVPLATVRSVHLHGNGDRIASLEGAELRRERARFTFTFSSGTTGTPVQRWDTEGLANGFVVHEIRKVSVFVAKAPIAIHPRSRCHLAADGACTKDVPYAAAEAAKGTRVVVDGRMIGAVKRRTLGDAAMTSVAALTHAFGMADGPVAAVELLAGDEVVARASAEQWARLGKSIAFELPRHEHGKVRVRVPVELQAEPSADGAHDEDALVSAVVVYRKTQPLPRPLARITPETDRAVRLASAEAL